MNENAVHATIGLSGRQKQFDALFASTVTAMDYVYVGCDYIARPGCPVICVYIDRDEGVNADHCAEVSGQLQALIVAENAVSGSYALEVSSPGIERPLFNADQFRRVLGRRAMLRLHRPCQGRRKLAGIVRSVSDGVVAMENDDEALNVPLTDIAKARLIEAVVVPCRRAREAGRLIAQTGEYR